MIAIDLEAVQDLLQEVGRRHPSPDKLYLVGGSGLLLIGSSRQTVDIDYVVREDFSTTLHTLLKEVASEKGLPIEPVPIDEFVPVVPNANHRHIFIGTYGQLDVFLFDPYSIALSKLDRGLDTDMTDVHFLIEQGLVQTEMLSQVVDSAIPHWREFDLDREGILARLATLKH